MEIRPMVDIQTAVARQEDVKREQQRELKARETAKRKIEERSRLNQERKDQSVASPQEIDDEGNVVNAQVDVLYTPTPTFPHRDQIARTKEEPRPYFKDPNLGGKIDISS